MANIDGRQFVTSLMENTSGKINCSFRHKISRAIFISGHQRHVRLRLSPVSAVIDVFVFIVFLRWPSSSGSAVPVAGRRCSYLKPPQLGCKSFIISGQTVGQRCGLGSPGRLMNVAGLINVAAGAGAGTGS